MTFGEHTAGVELLWGTRPQPKRGPKPALSLDQIAQTAIDIADAEDLGAVSMEQIGRALNFTKMSLYRYVPGKKELIALMIDRALGTPPGSMTAMPGWRERLDFWARAMFDAFLAHPWTLPATVGSRPIGPNELLWAEYAVAALDETPLSPAQKLDTVAVLAGHVRGIASQQAAMGNQPEEQLGAMMAGLAMPRADRFPAIARTIAAIAAGGPEAGQNQALDFGLNRILDGLSLIINEDHLMRSGKERKRQRS
ncbi:MAG TPA: TetR family transcriptional regulator [Micromonosporaceae bacterium]|nr:TetR family transcriptional regulator [Micromonosporaceae bacterium]